jgi:hypothetical protein
VPDADGRQRLRAALLCLAVALAIGCIGWAAPAGLRAPPAVVYVAAATFASGGATLLLQALGYARLQAVPAFLMGLGLTGVGAWVAFGAGSRQCQASVGGLGFLPPELACRVAFGIGTLFTGVVAVLMLRPLFSRNPHPPEGAG